MLLLAIFIVGYLAIVFEQPLKLNKSASALLVGVGCWIAYAAGGGSVDRELTGHLAGIAQIVFFLLGAMTIVELIAAHDGFELITSRIRTTSRRKLCVIVALLAFFLSGVLDNLTASIVMISLVGKLTTDERDRRYFGGLVIIAANSGGVWTPIGDVTTTMLWLGGQITTTKLVGHLIVPAIVSVIVPLLWVMWRLRGNVERPAVATTTRPRRQRTVLALGLGVLIAVPAFKVTTGLPPVMGMLLGLGLLWAVVDRLHDHAVDELSVARALQRVDAPSVLFFTGILLAISALESSGMLHALARTLDDRIGNVDLITMSIGLSSSVVDNVPLVAASQGMYPLETFPTDHHFWLFLAYCAGTGGSILIIGSAAGVAVMGAQRITFGWYVRHMTVPALLGYLAGALAYLALAQVMST